MIRIAIILAALLLTASIFILDGWTPLGFAHGLLYVFPVLLLRNEAATLQIAMAALAIILIVLGYLVSPAGFTDAWVILNRSLGIVVIAVITILQTGWRKTRPRAAPAGAGPAI